jgi:hypothetical protein
MQTGSSGTLIGWMVKQLLEVWWHAATLFVYFIFILHYMTANGYI